MVLTGPLVVLCGPITLGTEAGIVLNGVITQPKEEGGIGNRDASLANTSLLGKLVWFFLQNSYKLCAQVLSHKYLGRESILDVVANLSSSSLWKGILKARDVLKDGFSFKVGNGETSLWYGDWSEHGILASKVSYVNISDTNLILKDVTSSGVWNCSNIYPIIPSNMMNKLLEIAPRIDARLLDQWTWKHCRQGFYTAAAAYSWLIESMCPVTSNSVSWS